MLPASVSSVRLAAFDRSPQPVTSSALIARRGLLSASCSTEDCWNPWMWSVAIVIIHVEDATCGLSRRSATMASMNGPAKPGRVAMMRTTSPRSKPLQTKTGDIRPDGVGRHGGLRTLELRDPAGAVQGGHVPHPFGSDGIHAVGQDQVAERRWR
jgi:hypothetical protein